MKLDTNLGVSLEYSKTKSVFAKALFFFFTQFLFRVLEILKDLYCIS